MIYTFTNAISNEIYMKSTVLMDCHEVFQGLKNKCFFFFFLYWLLIKKKKITLANANENLKAW